VPHVADAVKVPVVAAGGIADGRGIAAAFALGASAVQIGTAYLHCPEAPISTQLRAALRSAKERITAVSNVVSGRPARVFMTPHRPRGRTHRRRRSIFPLGGVALAPLRAKAEVSRL